MSTGKATKTYSREETTLEEKGKLILGKDFVTKVHYLHTRIKSVEWSGILVYNQKEGTISEPDKLVIEVIDFLPMDVGSSSATEYDFDSSDDDWQNLMADAAEKGYKIGHIHTHHNMSCFFSGTDMGELHENAGSHNYYLSLIVNFKEVSEWCAKIAIFGEEHHEGVRKTEGEYKITKTWKAEEGEQTFEEQEDLSNEEKIDEKVEKLYMIDLELEMTEELAGLSDRITELLKPKVNYTTTHKTHNIKNLHAGGGGHTVGFHQKNKQGAKEEKKEKSDQNAKKGSQVVLDYDENAGDEVSPNGRDVGQFSVRYVKPLLVKLLALDEKNTDSLDDILLTIIQGAYDDQLILIDKIVESFPKFIENHYKIVSDDIDQHCVAVSCEDILTPYSQGNFVRMLIEELQDEFILPQSYASIPLTRRLTGVSDYAG